LSRSRSGKRTMNNASKTLYTVKNWSDASDMTWRTIGMSSIISPFVLFPLDLSVPARKRLTMT
jgi:hypothetical protein